MGDILNEEQFILCMPVDGPAHYVTPGSKIFPCVDCGCKVQAAPSSQVFMEKLKSRLSAQFAL